jgi:hypothetical protein
MHLRRGIRSPGERDVGGVDIGIPDDYAGGDIDLVDAVRKEQIANALTSADLEELGSGDAETDQEKFAN